jgi:hypothetical protein
MRPHAPRGRPRRGSLWLSIRVELVDGRGERLWPRPGRLFAAAPTHSFAQLAIAIDDAFARWDRSHLHEFRLMDGTRIGIPDPDFDDHGVVHDGRTKLSRLKLSEQFAYVFDFGDDWTHVCTVGPTTIDPVERVGIVPSAPMPYFGWGQIPDQYGRRWQTDDGESPIPPDPGSSDLPRQLFPEDGLRTES